MDDARAWLNLQISFALAGSTIWLIGTYLEQDFVAGVGAGLIVAALLLRIGRKEAADDAPSAVATPPDEESM